MYCRLFSLLLLSSALVFCTTQPVQTAEPAPDFETEIVPLLINRCVECHQDQNKSGNLSLVTRKGFLQGGDSGSALDLKRPLESHLLQRVQEGEMPPEKQGQPQKLSAKEINVLERWVAAGSPWPEDRKIELFERTTELRAGRDWWSLQPIQRPEIPEFKTEQPTNPIDAFILKRLKQNQITAAPRADKRTLLRRLYYDLTGLPPTLAEIQEFERDTSPDAWERRIDQLLASPHYGERWARYWLDLVRYADTSGYERDQEKPFAWKYRDWVVKALNSDIPYGRFITEQLAGDELPNRSKDTVIATGFLRLGTWNDEPNDPLDYQYDRLEDLVHTTSTAFLGMTVKCARCHSHKFDPITQEDYYRMASAFWAGPIAARDRGLLGGSNPDELGYPDVLGWTDLKSKPRPLHLLKNGEREHPQQVVNPASLSMIPALESPFTPQPEGASSSHRRLQLARWITDAKHPLTARVLVNRLWLHHFGEGIVRSPNNFGFLADPPTHPELLDWLAAEFMSGGWTIKRMHKLILTSNTWRQSSLHPRAAEIQQQDAGNRLWWRAERRRLDAEALRDSMLATTGELDLQMGGPGFRPTISAAALEGLSKKSNAWNASPPGAQNRRSLYTFLKRGLLPPLMTTFDLCNSTQSCGKRDITTVPTQSLAMLNHQFVHGRSETLAQTISAHQTAPQSQVRQLWERVYARPPSPEEMQLALRHLAVQRQHFETYRLQKPSQGKERETGSSLVLHLRADKGVTADSDGFVREWRDLSGNNHHAWQSTRDRRPLLTHEKFGSNHPAIFFDGKRRFMKLRGKILTGQEFTIIAVVNDLGAKGHREILSNWNGGAGNAGTSLFLGLTSKNRVRFSDHFSDAGSITDREKPFMMTAISGNGIAAVYQNGQKLSSRTQPLAPRNLSTDWVIGQQGNINGEYWNGGIAELRVYSRALSDDARLSVETELSQHHRLSLPKVKTALALSPKTLALASLCHVLLNSNEFLYVD